MSETTEKILVACVMLTVTRDAMTILPAKVPAHEVEIMKAVHGEENVREIEGPADAVEIDPEGEAERLMQKYGREALEAAYGTNFKGKLAKACAEHAVKAKKTDKQPA